MFSRGVGLCSILALVTVAQGGVTVQLVPTPNLPQYPPSSVVQVDVKLLQDAGGANQNIRMVEFDLLDTVDGFLIVTLPLTHDKGTPNTSDDIHFWSFSSLAACVSQPSFCGFNHFIDDDMPAGVVDTRNKILSSAYFGLTADAQAQIVLPSNGTPVTVGKLQVTMPPSPGTFTLNLMNDDDTGLDRGARVDFGFDPHIIWRARNPDNGNCMSAGQPEACCTGPGTGTCPNHLSGGKLPFTVCSTDPCPGTGSCCVSGNCSITTQAACSGTWNQGGSCIPNPCGGCTVNALKWESVLTHGTVGPVALDIPNTGLFSEPRSGIKKIVVTFDGALDPATVIPANVTVCGNNFANSPVNLSGVTITTTAVAPGNTQMEINFAPALPDFARYRITLNNIKCVGGNLVGAGTGGLSRILTALQGDANGDRRVNVTDVGGARSLIPTDPINPAVLTQVRSDANNDKRINATDVGGIRSKVGNDARNITDPVCP